MASKLLKVLAPARKYILKDIPIRKYTQQAVIKELNSLPRTQISTLDKNGFRIASENTGSPISTVGLWIDSGTKYETEDLCGATHCLEHLLFAGTSNRSKAQLEAELDNLGVELKAKAGREHIELYANCLTKDVPKVVEILGDIANNHKITDEDFDKLKNEILLEIKERDDNPKKVVMDYMHSFAYQQTPLALSKVGTVKSISAMTKQNVLDYARDALLGPRVVLACSGGVGHDELASLGKKHFESLKIDYKGEIPITRSFRYTAGELRNREDDMGLSYIAIAVEGPGWDHKDHMAMKIGQYLMGKWDITHGGGDNSSYRLAHYYTNNKFSTKKYESFYKAYQTTGLFGVYQVNENRDLQDLLPYFHLEFLRHTKYLFDSEVLQAKNHLRHHLYSTASSSESSCKDIGTQVLRYNSRKSLADVENEIEGVTTEGLQNTMYDYIYDRCPVVVGYGHVEALPEYNRTRMRMFQFKV